MYVFLFSPYSAKVVAWFKQEGDVVKRNDVLCDIETKVRWCWAISFSFFLSDSKEQRVVAHMETKWRAHVYTFGFVYLCFSQDFTFGLTVDDEEDGIMGTIVVPAGSDPIDDGDLLCILLHRSQGENDARVMEPNAGDDNDNTDNKPVTEK